MADRYVVAAGGNSDSASTYSATNGGAGGAGVPTAADNLFLTSLSGNFNHVAGHALPCLNFDATGYTGTYTRGAAAALSLAGSATLSGTAIIANGFGITFSGSGNRTLQTNGALAAVTHSGTGTLTLLDNLNGGPSLGFSWLAGNFNQGGFTMTLRFFTASAGTYSNPGPINITNTTISETSFAGAGKTYGAVSIATNQYLATISGANTFASLALSSTAGAHKIATIALAANQIVTGTLTMSGSSATNRLFLCSSVVGTQRTITANLSNANANVDFLDIAGAGAGAPFTGTSLGDMQGNSGITCDTPLTIYGYFPGGSQLLWSSSAVWFLGPGGTGGAARIPLAQDDVIFTDASFTGNTTPTILISLEMPRAGRNLDFSGTTRPYNFSVAPPNSNQGVSIHGSITHGMGCAVSQGGWFYMRGRSACTFAMPNLTAPVHHAPIEIACPGGSVTILHSLSTTFGIASALRIFLTAGTLDFNGKDIHATYLVSTTGLTRTLNMGSGTIFMYGHNSSGSPPWNVSAAGMTLNAGTSTLVLASGSDGNPQSMTLGGFAYNKVRFMGARNPVTLASANTIDELQVDHPRPVILQANQTVRRLIANGLPRTGSDYRFGLVTASGFFANTPSAAFHQITGDLTMIAKVVLGGLAWVGLQRWVFASKRATATTGEFDWVIESSGGGGVMSLSWYSAGGVAQSGNTTTNLSTMGLPTDGTPVYFKVERDNDRGDARYEVKCYWSLDKQVWTQLGTTSVGAAVANVGSTANSLTYGGSASGNSSAHRLLEFELYSGIGVGAVLVEKINAATDAVAAGAMTWTSPISGALWSLDAAGASRSRFAWSNEIPIWSGAAVVTLTKPGGGRFMAPSVNLRNVAASPADTWYTPGGADEGGNAGWVFGGFAIADDELAGTVTPPAALSGVVGVPTALVGVVQTPAAITGVAQ